MTMQPSETPVLGIRSRTARADMSSCFVDPTPTSRLVIAISTVLGYLGCRKGPVGPVSQPQKAGDNQYFQEKRSPTALEPVELSRPPSWYPGCTDLIYEVICSGRYQHLSTGECLCLGRRWQLRTSRVLGLDGAAYRGYGNAEKATQKQY